MSSGAGPAPERVGVLGGTFDPIHVAHVVAAVTVRHALALDRVVLVVAGDPWQKRGSVVASAVDRLAMTRAAVDGLAGIEVSALEVERTGPTYTIDTLRALATAERELFLIVGSDVASGLDSWHRAEEVRAAATLVVVSREHDGLRDDVVQPAHVRVRIPRLDVSSSEVRRRIGAGEPIDGLVPEAVVRVLRERHLYTRT